MSVPADNPTSDGAALPPGARIGKYEIVEQIGAGGQTIVYKGYDPLLDRPVAIKQIAVHLAADPLLAQKFRREAQILARFGGEHANVVSVYDLVENEQGLFIVLEYVRGHTLARVMERQRYAMPVPAALEILWHIAKGLKSAHDVGIVHRDLKPGNVLVTPEYRAKITDFGVAAQAGSQDALALGTARYMAPELFGKDHVDRRADLYSLGFMAYEMLTGREFFDRLFAEMPGDGQAENLRWMQWHCDSQQQAPPLAQVNPLVPTELSQVVERMMAKDPARRFASADELLATLHERFAGRRYRDGRFVRPGEAIEGKSQGEVVLSGALAASEPSTPPLPARAGHPRARLAMATGVVLLLVGAGAALALAVRHQHDVRRQQAQVLYDRASEVYRTAEGLYDRIGGDPMVAEGFSAAQFNFEGIQQDYRNLDVGRAAAARVELARAWLAMLQGDWNAADACSRRAAAFSAVTEQELQAFARRLAARQDASRLLSQADAAIAGKDLDTAAAHLAGLAQVAEPPADLVAQAAQLQQVLASSRRHAAFGAQVEQADQALAQADRHIEAGEFDEAARLLEEAAGFYAAAQAGLLGGIQGEGIAELPIGEALAAARDALDDQVIAERLARLEVARTFLEARRRYARAVAEEDLAAQVEALQAAVAARPSERVRQLLHQTQAQEAFARGQALRGEDGVAGLEQAQAALTESLAYAELPETALALTEVEAQLHLARLIAEGEAHLAAEQYEQAVAAFQKAVAAAGDDGERLVQAKVMLHLAEAQAARYAQQWEEALAAYERLRQVSPEDPQIVQLADEGVARVGRERDYHRQLSEAAAAMEAGQYSRAVGRINRAVEIAQALGIPHEEALELKNQASYAWEMQKGEEARRQGDLEAALAHYRLAAKRMDSPEVRNLIAIVEAALKD